MNEARLRWGTITYPEVGILQGLAVFVEPVAEKSKRNTPARRNEDSSQCLCYSTLCQLFNVCSARSIVSIYRKYQLGPDHGRSHRGAVLINLLRLKPDLARPPLLIDSQVAEGEGSGRGLVSGTGCGDGFPGPLPPGPGTDILLAILGFLLVNQYLPLRRLEPLHARAGSPSGEAMTRG